MACKRITVRRRRRGGPILPKSQHKTFTRCDNKSLSTSAKARYRREKPCRAGSKAGKSGKAKFNAMKFTEC
jgi:hypothetical protein